MDTRSLATKFEKHLRKRGEALFREHRVTGGSSWWDTRYFVQDGRAHEVALGIHKEHNRISWYCTCGESEHGRLCEHIWAAVLQASQDGHFGTRIEELENEKNNEFLSDMYDGESKPAVSKECAFILNVKKSLDQKVWTVQVKNRYIFSDGSMTNFFNESVSLTELRKFKNPNDKAIIREIFGSRLNYSYYGDYGKSSISLYAKEDAELLKLMSRAGKLFIKKPGQSPKRMSFEPNSIVSPLTFRVRIDRQGKDYLVTPCLVCKRQEFALTNEMLHLRDYTLVGETLFLSNLTEFEPLILEMRKYRRAKWKAHEIPILLKSLFAGENVPDLILPKEFQYKIESKFNKARLLIDKVPGTNALSARIEARYGDEYAGPDETALHLVDPDNKKIFKRDMEGERKIKAQLFEAVGRVNPSPGGLLLIKEKQLFPLIEKAFALKWEVVAFKKSVSRAGEYKVKTTSGIDWFDLSMEMKFSNGQLLTLPDLLKGIKSGRLLTLADGSLGILNDEVIKKFSHLGLGAKIVNGKVRLSKVQALYYAASLEEDSRFRPDTKFKTINRLSISSQKPQSSKSDRNFVGRLRGYQKKALGWLEGMTKQNVGCLLADDMGLGKTICILALLSKQLKGQALIVMPKSLIDNWVEEAKRFTPHLKVHTHVTGSRHREKSTFKSADIILTTYHTVRHDVDFFSKMQFEYLILDEAQNIKNPDADIHRSSRLIRAQKKIALTGTPIENSMGDLFAIMNIIAPGLISKAAFEKHAGTDDPTILRQFHRAVRPFFLRRRKEEVLKDLPKKTEQTLYCELTPSERREYDHLKRYHHGIIKGLIQEKGMAKAQANIFKALNELRQAACHQGIMKPSKANKPSAKFEMLLEHVETIVAEKNKILIFSNWKEPLRLLKRELNKREIRFDYMDGETTKRQDVVNRFQSNDQIQVLLMTMKTGGVGLNLTAANYVFLLDPWWNPAAESQAIDRTHRIGQNRKVMAYKLIAKDTVEEKMLALQKKKKSIANAIMEGTGGFKNLTEKEIESLFL